ncbi:MAG TPA: hypothetical protein VFN02_09105 [Ktedonobacteraceae bacterium]|nr:hypothetical protein [Ktedonobacteraceae bacterium]
MQKREGREAEVSAHEMRRDGAPGLHDTFDTWTTRSLAAGMPVSGRERGGVDHDRCSTV